ncbi:glycosyltransferase [Tsukamurella serpentis]
MLWLSPWMRPLARVHCEQLLGAGWQVRLITSDQHPESDAARPYERVLRPAPKTLATWPEFAGELRRVRAFRPDVVVTELVRDPRWTAFAGRVPRVDLVHDDRPHGAEEELPGWERALFGRWRASSTVTAGFSEYVARAVGADAVIPLTSDLDEALVPAPVPAVGRRNFVAVGRLSDYKNLDVTLRAWRRHIEGPGWRGDELVLIGDGPDRALGDAVQWRRGPYSYADVLPVLAAAKGSVAHYRRASQSGVQVLSMQLAVVPIVSPEGALPQFQPPGESAIGVDDVAGLAAAFDRLADPELAARRGAAAREHYLDRHAAPVAGAALDLVLSAALS